MIPNYDWLGEAVFVMQYINSEKEKYYMVFTENWIFFYSLNITPDNKKYWTLSKITSTSLLAHYKYIEEKYSEKKFKILVNKISFYA